MLEIIIGLVLGYFAGKYHSEWISKKAKDDKQLKEFKKWQKNKKKK